MFKEIKNPFTTKGGKGGCLVRALMNVLNKTSDEIVEFAEDNGFMELDSPRLLEYAMRKNGFKEVKSDSPMGTIGQYIKNNKSGTSVVLVDQYTNTHAVAIIEGNHYDTYDSINDVIVRVFEKESN